LKSRRNIVSLKANHCIRINLDNRRGSSSSASTNCPKNQFSLKKDCKDCRDRFVSIYFGSEYTPSVILPVLFQPRVSVADSERNLVSISSMFLVIVSF